jgi:hypothetical protein
MPEINGNDWRRSREPQSFVSFSYELPLNHALSVSEWKCDNYLSKRLVSYCLFNREAGPRGYDFHTSPSPADGELYIPDA